jgi:hypothetical protein
VALKEGISMSEERREKKRGHEQKEEKMKRNRKSKTHPTSSIRTTPHIPRLKYNHLLFLFPSSTGNTPN